ncbi:MAG: hypothetical protein KGZ69_06770 [Methylomonas sp.]|nr:hypothetical protein [Methylomonas sp.]
MKHGKILLAVGTLFSLNSQAALYDRGNGLVYDDVLNATWSKDTNLLKTLANASGNSINYLQQIITASNGKVYDGYNGGDHTLTLNDFGVHPNGNVVSMTWWGAHGFIDYLNSTNYQGYNNWRLPSLSPINGTNFNTNSSYNGATDAGYNITSPTSELSYMWHINLHLPDSYLPNGQLNPAWTNTTGYFLNFADAANANASDSFTFGGNQKFWTELVPNPNAKPSMFYIFYGAQTINESESSPGVGAWIVRSGDVAPVPVPGAIWLFSSGLLGVLGLKRRNA